MDNIVRKYINTSFPCRYRQKADFAGHAYTPALPATLTRQLIKRLTDPDGCVKISSIGVHIYNTKMKCKCSVSNRSEAATKPTHDSRENCEEPGTKTSISRCWCVHVQFNRTNTATKTFNTRYHRICVETE